MTSPYPFTYDSNLESLVLSLTAGKPQEKAFEALTNWVSEKVEYDKDLSTRLDGIKEKGYIRYGELGLKDSLEVFNQRKGICCEASYLLVTMARIAGINAEFVNVNEDLNGNKINHACTGAEINGTYILADPIYKKFNIAHRRFEPAGAKKVIRIFRKANGSYNPSDDDLDYEYTPRFIRPKKPGEKMKNPEEKNEQLKNSLCSVVEEPKDGGNEKHLAAFIENIIKVFEGAIEKIDHAKQSRLEKIEKPEKRPWEYSQKSEDSTKNPYVAPEEQRKEQKSVDAVKNIENKVEQEMTAGKQITNFVNPTNKSKESKTADYAFGRKLFWPAVIAATIFFSLAMNRVYYHTQNIKGQERARIEYILNK